MSALRSAIALAALALAACDTSYAPAPHTVVPITPFLGLPVMGDPDAPVLLTEYASTTCGHCKAFHDEVFPLLKQNYIDTGKVRLAWIVLPTAPDALSRAGGAIARCAGEDRFFAAIDALFDAQDTFFDVASKPDRLEQELLAVGAKFDLSRDEVITCIDDPSIRAATNAALADMPASITGTPSFVIGGQKLEVESYEGLSGAIDAELANLSPAAGQAPQ